MASTGRSLKVEHIFDLSKKVKGVTLYDIISTGSSIKCGDYSIQSENIENYEDFIVTDLKITYNVTGEERHVCHFQFTSWPDYGTPDSALSMLQFLQVRECSDVVTCDNS